MRRVSVIRDIPRAGQSDRVQLNQKRSTIKVERFSMRRFVLGVCR